MNFGQAISSGFSNYVKFSGRAMRSEYWYWVLFTVLGDDRRRDYRRRARHIGHRSALFGLATLLPSLAVQVRRLHDLDRTGWWIFIGVIPLIGWIILIIWYCSRGTAGPNRFGPDALATDGWARAAA